MPVTQPAPAPEPVVAEAPPPAPAYVPEPAAEEPVEEAPPPPRKTVAKPAPPPPRPNDMAIAWWHPESTAPFKVVYVGAASAQSALVIRFSKEVGSIDAVSPKIQVYGPDGKPVAGNWVVGGNKYVVVRSGLKPGRYIVNIDAGVPSSAGESLGIRSSGPIYVQ
jgi:hypothetical protein